MLGQCRIECASYTWVDNTHLAEQSQVVLQPAKGVPCLVVKPLHFPCSLGYSFSCGNETRLSGLSGACRIIIRDHILFLWDFLTCCNAVCATKGNGITAVASLD